MPKIDDSVGTGGANKIHDVCMVQLLLKLARNKLGQPYYGHDYNTHYDRDTDRAIRNFQQEHGLVTAGPAKPAAPRETAGAIAPGGATWAALVKELAKADKRYLQVRTMPGVAVAYLPMPKTALGGSVAEIQRAKLRDPFKQNLLKLVRDFYDLSETVLTLVPQTGAFRTFAGQEGLVSDAGYGESVHQFGYAVDIGFRNLPWIANDLSIAHKEVGSLMSMKENLRKQLFAARNEMADRLDIHATTKQADLQHLQAFDDTKLDSVGSLQALLEKVGPRKMKWATQWMTPTNYLCDLGLGLGETKFYVGTAITIWEEDPADHISAADLATALNLKKKSAPAFSLETFLGNQAQPLPAELKPTDIRPGHFQIVQRMLKGEFEAAAAHTDQWVPVNYPQRGPKRDKNPRKKEAP